MKAKELILLGLGASSNQILRYIWH